MKNIQGNEYFMEKKSYYAILTKRFTLKCNHYELLRMTQERYNEVLLFYYQLYLKQDFLWKQGRQEALRSLEKLTIPGRDKFPIPYPLPGEKVPLYLRRAAINAAIAAAKGYLTRQEQGIKGKKTECFHNVVTYYKGMYRNFTEKGIDLKVWNGQDWFLIHCRLSNNTFAEREEKMSPTVVLKEHKLISLHVPVRVLVECSGKAKNVMSKKEGLCCVQFTNEDALAVGVILSGEGEQRKVFFLRGGKEYQDKCRRICEKIASSRMATGYEKNPNTNRKYWEKLRNVSNYYAHKISRQVINNCKKNKIEILLLPKYKQEYKDMVMHGVGKWTPLSLSNRIREQLQYKAWKEGILLLETNPYKTEKKCSICGGVVTKKGQEIYCVNGHKLNYQINMLRNLGRKCLKSFEEKRERR